MAEQTQLFELCEWSTDHWATPWATVRGAEAYYGATFDLDPCCTSLSAKAPYYYTEEDDGLALPWFGRVFLNPPYSNITPWLERALEERDHYEYVLALLPACTDTSWFHELVMPYAAIAFIRGRIEFHAPRARIARPKTPSIWALYQGERRCSSPCSDRTTPSR